MKYKCLPRSFYARDTQRVARELLGKVLVRRWRNILLAGRITEVEAYVGEDDLACHAARGPTNPAGRRTARTEIMYGEAGHAYVYLIYGMYHCLNIVTDQKNFPAAVLIRSVEPLAGIDVMQRRRKQRGANKVSAKGVRHPKDKVSDPLLTTGPGKLTQALGITRTLNGEDITVSRRLWVADDGGIVSPRHIATSPRIGVAYAKHCALYPWRYCLKDSKFLSQPA